MVLLLALAVLLLLGLSLQWLRRPGLAVLVCWLLLLELAHTPAAGAMGRALCCCCCNCCSLASTERLTALLAALWRLFCLRLCWRWPGGC